MPTRVLKRGLLVKRTVSATFVRPWRNQLVLLRDDAIEWRNANKPDVTIGSLVLSAQTVAATSTERASALCVTADGVHLVLSAETDFERDAWLAAIRAALGALGEQPPMAPGAERRSYVDHEHNLPPEPATFTITVVVSSHHRLWLESHHLETEMTEALSSLVEAGPAEPLGFLAAHFSKRRKVVPPTKLVRLQAVVRGHLSRRAVRSRATRSDSMAHELLMETVARKQADGKGSKWFASLATIQHNTVMNAFPRELVRRHSFDTTFELSEVEQSERVHAEELNKEMLRLAETRQSYLRKSRSPFHSSRSFPSSSGSPAPEPARVVIDALREYQLAHLALAHSVVTLSNPYSDADFSDHVAGDSRWWKVGLHNHGPNGAELLGFFPCSRCGAQTCDPTTGGAI